MFAALWRIAPTNLLIARLANADHAPGSVEILRPGLFAGYVSRFSPYAAVSVDTEMLATWTEICRKIVLMASRAPTPGI